MEGFEAVKKELEAKRMQLEHELDEAKGKLAVIESDLRRVDEALGALTKSKAKKKGKSRASPRSSDDACVPYHTATATSSGVPSSRGRFQRFTRR